MELRFGNEESHDHHDHAGVGSASVLDARSERPGRLRQAKSGTLEDDPVLKELEMAFGMGTQKEEKAAGPVWLPALTSHDQDHIMA